MESRRTAITDASGVPDVHTAITPSAVDAMTG
jgi:hypothetical protein